MIASNLVIKWERADLEPFLSESELDLWMMNYEP